MKEDLLKKIGFTDKQASVYLSLLSLGPSSVRSVASHSEINRQSVYEILKWMQEEGIVTWYHQEKKQYFVAEDPVSLLDMVKDRQLQLKKVGKELEQAIPTFRAMHEREGERPVAKYYRQKGIKHILEDVLTQCKKSDENLYRIYSAVDVREYIYDEFSEFSEKRIEKKIAVKVIAIGEGGQLRGLDERKWLSKSGNSSTYIIIYPGRTAYISLNNAKEPIGVVIENNGVYETQKIIFDALWEGL